MNVVPPAVALIKESDQMDRYTWQICVNRLKRRVEVTLCLTSTATALLLLSSDYLAREDIVACQSSRIFPGLRLAPLDRVLITNACANV
jgi:hypothetical protein